MRVRAVTEGTALDGTGKVYLTQSDMEVRVVVSGKNDSLSVCIVGEVQGA